MPKSARTSRSRRSSQYNILNYNSDFDQNTGRDSKWWRNISDRSVGDIRYLANENDILSDGSYPYGDVDSQWWKQLGEDESTILQRNAFKNRNISNSVVEEDEKTAHESHTEHNDENVTRKTLFTDRQLRSGNHRFSKAFHLEQDQTNEPQVTQEETNTHNSGETTNEKNKSTKTIPRTGESLKVKVKRKTIQLFSRKAYSQRFSEAFHSADEEKIENEQQDESNLKSQVDNEQQHSEIIVPATQESQETHRKSQFVTVQDTVGNIGEENAEINETLAKNKTNLGATTDVEKKHLFANTQEKKRTFSEAFSKTAVDETCIDEESKTNEKISENTNVTVDTEINENVGTKKELFEQKQTRSRKFSEAFSKTKHSDDSIDKSHQDASVNQIDKSTKLVERKSKSPRKSQIKQSEQTKNLEKINEEILENTITVRKSPRLSKNNESNQMEMSENIQMKQNLFQAKTKESRKFSAAFADTKNLETTSAEGELTNIQEENNILSENSKISRKSTRVSKNNDTNQMEVSENIQIKQNLFQAKIKESRKFSEAFADTKNLETISAEEELTNIQEENNIVSENSKISRKSTRISKNNEISQMELNENLPTINLFNILDKKQSRKFSDAFDKSKITEQRDDNLPYKEAIERESVRSTRNSKQKSELLTKSIPSEINTNDENIPVRKSLRSSKINETNQMEISENIQTKQDLFNAKVKETRKFSDAFDKSKITEQKEIEKDDNLPDTDAVERESVRSTRNSKQKSELLTKSIPSEINTNDENIPVRKSLRSSKINETNQMEISENIQTKQDLFNAKVKETRKFSDAFDKSKITEQKEIEKDDNLPDTDAVERESVRSTRNSKQKSELLTKSIPSEINTNDENIPVRKSLRSSKINETNQMEISENIQTKQDLFKAKVKETRKFSEAFAETRIIDKNSDEKELSDNQRDNNIDNVTSKTNERKSTRKSEINSIKQTDTNEQMATKKDLFKNKIKENRKFSEAFAKSTYEEKMDNKSNEYQDMQRIKSGAENKTDQTNDSSHLSTLPSINDTVGDDKKVLFKPKARKSLFSVRNTPNRMKKIDENTAVQSAPKSSPAEVTDQNGVFSDTVTSKFFETSLISSTKLVINPNLTKRNSTDDSQVEENQNENKNKSQSKKSMRGSKIRPQGTSMQTENVENPEQESSQEEIDKPEVQINKDKSQRKRSVRGSNILPQGTSMQTENIEHSEQESSQEEIDKPAAQINKDKSRRKRSVRGSNILPQVTSMQTENVELTEQESSQKEIDKPAAQINKDKSQRKRSVGGSNILPQVTSMQTENVELTEQESSQKEIDKPAAQINKDKSQRKRSVTGSNILPQKTSMQTENVELTEQESSQEEIDKPAAKINKDKSQSKRSVRGSNILPQVTSMQADDVKHSEQESFQEEIDEPQTKSELTKNKSNVPSNDIYITSKKAPTDHEHTSALENSKTKTGLKNTTKRTTLSNEDNSKESQISPNPGKHSSKFITDDTQTYISNNKSSRVSTVAENTDKTTEDKSETRTSSHKNTSEFNLNDIEKNVTDNKLNRVSVQQDIDNNATETHARNSNLKYSTNLNEISNAERQSNITSHKKKESIKKSLQSEFGENEKSKKSMSRTENNMSKKVLRFTGNYENEIIDEDETLNSNVFPTNSASKSLQTNVIANKSNRTSVQQDADKNATDMQTHSRKSNLKYSKSLNELPDASRQSNKTESNKKSVRKSLQSEYGENEKSKKSMSRTENDMSKKLLRFTDNYENEIIDENANENSNVLSTNRVSKSSLIPIKTTERKSKGNASSKPKNVNKTPANDKKLQMQKELLLNEMKQTPSRITTQQLPFKKITDFFSKINFNERQKITQNKVTKPKPKPISTAKLVNGQIYRPKKLFSGQRWCNKRFYKYLQNRLQNKYGETTILESENLMKSIADSVKIISKSKHYAAGEIAALKKELARYNVISTTFDFYQLVENYLPCNIRDKVVPCTKAHYAEPSVPYDHEGLFKTIEI